MIDKKSFFRKITKLKALGFSFFWAKPKGQEIDMIKIILN